MASFNLELIGTGLLLVAGSVILYTYGPTVVDRWWGRSPKVSRPSTTEDSLRLAIWGQKLVIRGICIVGMVFGVLFLLDGVGLLKV